jgi:hypothetical protein
MMVSEEKGNREKEQPKGVPRRNETQQEAPGKPRGYRSPAKIAVQSDYKFCQWFHGIDNAPKNGKWQQGQDERSIFFAGSFLSFPTGY